VRAYGKSIASIKLTILPLLFFAASVFQSTSGGVARLSRSQPTSATSSLAAASSSSPRIWPVSFEPNEGQANPAVEYLSHGPGYAISLTQSEADIALPQNCHEYSFSPSLDVKTQNRLEATKRGRLILRHFQRCQSAPLQMSFAGASHNARLAAFDELSAKSNYFLGADRRKWRTGIPNYARVKYAGLYPGVDLVFYGNHGDLEFDYIISPGADPNHVALKFAPHERLRVAPNGSLQVGPLVNSVVFHRPHIYQMERGRQCTVQGRFALLRGNRVAFRLGSYNHREPLIIDPTLTYSTFLNGTTGVSDGDGIAVDSSGDAYIVGTTFSASFPTINGYQSTAGAPGNGIVFLAELNPTGTQLLYSTYLGGTGGDYGTDVAIDSSGNAYLTGYTFSTDFPVLNGFQTQNNNTTGGNAFVARIDTTKTGTASLVYSTYLGGGGNSYNPNSWYGDSGLGIAVDSSGHAYVTGATVSDASVTAFPTTSSAYQTTLLSANGNAFLTAVDTTQSGSSSLLYSTYLGGNGAGSFGDSGTDVSTDGAGNAYLVGWTTSNSFGAFPTTSSAYQSTLRGTSSNAFLTEIATTKSGVASLIYSTYFGGSRGGTTGDTAGGVALDSAGKVYVTGQATSANFPTTPGAYEATNSADGMAFVAKFDTTQTGSASLLYSTLLGGATTTMGDVGEGIVVDTSGDAFVVGQTSSTSFPTTSNAYQSSLNSSTGWNAFLSEVNPTASSLVYSTYLGGDTNFGAIATGVALDSLSDAYIVGYTNASDFPTTTGAYQTTLNGSTSAFVAEIDSPNGPSVAVSASPANATIQSGQSATYAISVMSQGAFTSPITFGCEGLPKYAACSFSPASVASDSKTAQTTLMITTSASPSALWFPENRVPTGRMETFLAAAALCFLIMGSVFIFAGARKPRWKFGALLGAMTLILCAAGCAATGSALLTPPGTNQVTVQASGQTTAGVVAQSTTLGLTIH
jgi:hypothetical protein